MNPLNECEDLTTDISDNTNNPDEKEISDADKTAMGRKLGLLKYGNLRTEWNRNLR